MKLSESQMVGIGLICYGFGALSMALIFIAIKFIN